MNRDRDFTLPDVQRWLQTVITDPRGIAAGLQAAQSKGDMAIAPEEVDSIIAPSQRQTSEQRLGVYSNAYFARLMQCMRELFPALTAAVGEDVFDRFSVGYLRAYPPRSYTLGRLADRFCQYLQETRPVGPEQGDWPGFVIDLARLEWTIDEVFDGPGTERSPTLSLDVLQAIPAEQWPDTRLTLAPCLRLLSLSFPVNDYYTAYRSGETPALPSPRKTYVAITRRDYIVRRFELSEPQFALLSTLQSGHSLGEAIEACAEHFDDLTGLPDHLQTWFAFWAANRFFVGVASTSK